MTSTFHTMTTEHLGPDAGESDLQEFRAICEAALRLHPELSDAEVTESVFGDVHGGLTAKVSNPKARKAFASRHNCKSKKDRMTAGYWACRLNRFGHLWGGKTYPGYW